MTALGVAALRIALVLTCIVAGSDLLVVVATGPDVRSLLEGIVLTGLALAGIARPRVAASVLLPRGRTVLLAAAFAAGTALDWGLQRHYGDVATVVVLIAAFVSSRSWTVLAVAVSALGFLANLALQGHSLTWMLAGDGRLVVSDQLILFAANAGGGLALVALARHFLAGSPQHIARARAAESIGRQPSIVRSPARRLLARGDPETLVTALSAAERRVLALLAAGRAPKQVARELDVALATVRTHIASAKRKTGARTLEQLVGLFAEASHAR